MYYDNESYLLDYLKIPVKKLPIYLDAMSKYPFKWWLSEDMNIIARFQMNEPVLLVKSQKLREAIAAVLGKKCSDIPLDSLSFWNIKLKEEVYSKLRIISV